MTAQYLLMLTPFAMAVVLTVVVQRLKKHS